MPNVNNSMSQGAPTSLVGPVKILKTGAKQLGPQLMRDKPKNLNNSRTESSS